MMLNYSFYNENITEPLRAYSEARFKKLINTID
jgi:hypothetical protein